MPDVYAYGVIAPSTLVRLVDPYPEEAGYGEIDRVHRSFGGEAAGSAHVLARLGIDTKLAGTRLSDDDSSRGALALLRAAGVDCTTMTLDAPFPMAEVVISSAGERTVLGTYGRMLEQRSWTPPSRDDIAGSRLVCLDPFLGDASEQAARWCREEEVPFVTVDVRPDSPIARGAAAVVISEEYAGHSLELVDPGDILEPYLEACDGLVILTRGSRSLFASRDGEIREFAPFEVTPIDTAGAGDSFRAGIAYGLLRGLPDDQTITTASALAAMVCQTSPGVLGSPTADELTEFLANARPIRPH